MQFGTNNYTPPTTNIPAGDYDFQVVMAEEMMSKSSGNLMIKLTLAVFVPGRSEPVKVYDHLVSTETALFKIEQFCVATGQPQLFRVNGTQVQGNVTPQDCMGKRGKGRFIVDRESGYLTCRTYLKPAGYTESPTPLQAAPVAPASPVAGIPTPF